MRERENTPVISGLLNRSFLSLPWETFALSWVQGHCAEGTHNTGSNVVAVNIHVT